MNYKYEPLVSVIVCTYKKFDNLSRNIQSIFSQTYPYIELIITDDGSDNFDRNYINKIIENKSNNINKTSIIHYEGNRGTVNNLSRAIKLASGDIIVELSEDDRLFSQNTISNIVKFMIEKNAEYVSAKRIGANSNKVYPLDKDALLLENGSCDEILRRMLVQNIISGASFYYLRNAYLRDGGYDTSFTLLEDYPFYLKLLEKERKIYLMNEITVVYGEDGVSSNKKANQLNSKLKNDYIHNMDIYILPYIDLIPKRIIRRYIKRRYEVLKAKKKTDVILIALKYLDLSFMNIYRKIIGDEDFEYYYHLVK